MLVAVMAIGLTSGLASAQTPASGAAKQPCRDAKGKLTKCGAPGAIAAQPAAPASAVPAPAPPAKAKTKKASGPAASASSTSPDVASAKCKDGSYWHSATHAGSCSHHGGVANFLK
jgi:hypothetical protein